MAVISLMYTCETDIDLIEKVQLIFRSMSDY